MKKFSERWLDNQHKRKVHNGKYNYLVYVIRFGRPYAKYCAKEIKLGRTPLWKKDWHE